MKISMFKFSSRVAVVLGMIAMTGCISATVADGVCDQQTVDFGTISQVPIGTLPNVMVPVSFPPQDVTLDLSKDVTQIDKVADQLTATITSLMVSNSSHDLDWVRSVNVNVSGTAQDGSTPQVELASGTYSNPGSELSLNVAMDPATALHYLSAGPVTLTITLSGEVSPATIPAGELTNDVQLCANVSGHFSK